MGDQLATVIVAALGLAGVSFSTWFNARTNRKTAEQQREHELELKREERERVRLERLDTEKHRAYAELIRLVAEAPASIHQASTKVGRQRAINELAAAEAQAKLLLPIGGTMLFGDAMRNLRASGYENPTFALSNLSMVLGQDLNPPKAPDA